MRFGDRQDDSSGPEVPFGAAGVAAVMAAVLGLIGILLPTALLQSIAFQLYLDTIIPAAVPPFGWLAHAVSALALFMVGGSLGWLLARLFRVRSGAWTLRRLIDRVRGIGAEDDADAPVLRSADRHPDAPARRPFSAANDIPGRDDDTHWSHDSASHTIVSDTSFADTAVDDGVPDADFADEELLLDGSFADMDETVPAVALAMTPDSALADPQPEAGLDSPAPAADVDVPVAAEAPAPVGPEFSEAKPAEPAAGPPAPQAPIDLSAGPLDALLARLEAGLAAHPTVAPPPAASVADVPPEPAFTSLQVGEPAAAPAVDTPQVAHDPALAAALATLRRMNQHVG